MGASERGVCALSLSLSLARARARVCVCVCWANNALNANWLLSRAKLLLACFCLDRHDPGRYDPGRQDLGQSSAGESNSCQTLMLT